MFLKLLSKFLKIVVNSLGRYQKLEKFVELLVNYSNVLDNGSNIVKITESDINAGIAIVGKNEF